MIPTATVFPALEVAQAGVSQNSDWELYSPYSRNFGGIEMVLVPAGCFMMGSADGESNVQPAHPICFDEPYWIDRYEVSNSQFRQYTTVAAIPPCFEDDVGIMARECISWRESLQYCEAQEARLPTEAEWEYAARGPDSLIFPWGNQYNSALANDRTENGEDTFEDTAPVNAFADGVSWVGAYQMSGNVWEWTSSIYDMERFPYPYNPDDGREDLTDLQALRVMRGGSFDNFRLLGISSVRQKFGSRYAYNITGLRCARDYDG